MSVLHVIDTTAGRISNNFMKVLFFCVLLSVASIKQSVTNLVHDAFTQQYYISLFYESEVTTDNKYSMSYFMEHSLFVTSDSIYSSFSEVIKYIRRLIKKLYSE